MKSFKAAFEFTAKVLAQAGLELGTVYKYANDTKMPGMTRKIKAAPIAGTNKKVVIRYEKVYGIQGSYDVFVMNDTGTGFELNLWNPQIEHLKKFVANDVVEA